MSHPWPKPYLSSSVYSQDQSTLSFGTRSSTRFQNPWRSLFPSNSLNSKDALQICSSPRTPARYRQSAHSRDAPQNLASPRSSAEYPHPGSKITTPVVSEFTDLSQKPQNTIKIRVRKDPRIQIDRRRVYVAQAIILSNVWGVVLSNGTFVEYYYNTYAFDRAALHKIGIIFAVQILCMFSAPLPVGWLYQKDWWSPMYISSALLILSNFLDALGKEQSQSYLRTVLVRGVLQGVSLGTLATMGTLCLASYFRNNVPLASMIGSSVGLMGGVVYAIVSYYCFPDPHQAGYKRACYIHTGMGATLLLACILIKRHKAHWKLRIRRYNGLAKLLRDRPCLLFVLGFWMMSFGLLSWPTYMVLMIASAPGQTWPTEATFQLMVTLGIGAIFSSAVGADRVRERSGAVNTLVCASLVAGVCYINPAFMPWPTITFSCTTIFGACLGAIISLYAKAASTMLTRKKGEILDVISLGVILLGAGISAAAGIVVTGVIVDYGTKGFASAMALDGLFCIFSALAMGWARFLGAGWRLYVII